MGKESFIKRALDGDERIIAIARITRWKFLDEILLAIGFVFVTLGVLLLSKNNAVITGIVGGMLSVVWIMKSFKDLIFINLTIFCVTTRKVLYKSGFVKTRSVDIPLRNIDNVQVEFSFVGKMFNFGTVRLESRSEPVTVEYVRNPNGFKNIIDRAAQGYVANKNR